MIDDPIVTIWERLLFSGARPVPSEVARYILQLGMPLEDRERMNELGDKAQDDALTIEERAELEAYSHAAAFLSILQSKARGVQRNAILASSNGIATA